MVAGEGLHRNETKLSRDVVWNAVDNLGHFSVGDYKHGLTETPEILISFSRVVESISVFADQHPIDCKR